MEEEGTGIRNFWSPRRYSCSLLYNNVRIAEVSLESCLGSCWCRAGGGCQPFPGSRGEFSRALLFFAFISFALEGLSKKILLQLTSENVLPVLFIEVLWCHILYLDL